MTAIQPPLTGAIEAELDGLHRYRDELLRATPCPVRSQLLADLFDHEAWLWSVLFDRTRSRLMWQAALGAEAHARLCARSWRRESARTATPYAPRARPLDGAAICASTPSAGVA